MEKKKTEVRKPARNLTTRKLTRRELTDVVGGARPTPGCCTQGCCE